MGHCCGKGEPPDRPPQTAPKPMSPMTLPMTPVDDASISEMAQLQQLLGPTDFKTDDFQVLGVLGDGAFGHVQLASYAAHGTGSPPQPKLYTLKSFLWSQTPRGECGTEHSLPAPVRNELILLAKCNQSRSVVHLHGSFSDRIGYHAVLQYAPGGDLFRLLGRADKLPEVQARFYTVGIVHALAHLHERFIVYRDLKPENILIQKDGYPLLADLGLAKQLESPDEWTHSMCGSPEYMAPELVARRGHGLAVDFWGIGIVIFEMLTGLPPFHFEDSATPHPMAVYKQIVGAAPICWPEDHRLSAHSIALVDELLQRNPRMRLTDWKYMLSHKWFARIDQAGVRTGKVPAPWVPQLSSDRDMRYCSSCNPTSPMTAAAQSIINTPE